MESDSRPPTPYAHARARDPLVDHLDVELDALRRMARRTRSAVSQLSWRRAVQGRANRVSTILWLLERVAPGRTVRRVKVKGAWCLTVEDVPNISTLVLVLDTGIGARTLAELKTPPMVRVHRRELVDDELLARLEAAGLVRIVPAETP
jgi:hypothetical protein